VESTESLSIADSVEQFGVFLVEGPAATILDTLSFDAVNALLSAGTFQQAKQQAQQSQGQQTETAPSEGAGTNTTSTATTTSPTSN
jgi:hypothetical protein